MARRAVTKAKSKSKAVVRRGRGLVVAASSNSKIKDLMPRDPDFVHYGPEPNFSEMQPDPDSREHTLGKTYNWYSHFYGPKEAKSFFLRYLEDTKANKEVIKIVKKVPDNRMVTTAGWIARAATRGLVLEQRQLDFIKNTIDKLTIVVKGEPVEEEKPVEKKAVRPNVQEIMREKAEEAGGDIEELYDTFILNGAKTIDIEKKVIGIVQSSNLLPQHIKPMIEHWENVRNEINETISGKCNQLKEAYSKYTKTQLKNKLKFSELVLSELHGYVSLKQTTRKVRTRKPVPVEKIVSKLRYCKTFKDEAQKLDLTSVHPSKLHNSTEAWVYDTKKRKIHHYVADDYSKCLIVKANTIVGFDKKESGIKTLRKPSEQLKEIMGSKPAARKYFKDIKAVETVPNGRFNADMVILRAF